MVLISNGQERTMLANQRHAYIMKYLNENGAARVVDLVSELGVSDMTIRRDLDLLARDGVLLKVHGGATIAHDSSALEPAFLVKSGLSKNAKDAIGAYAASLVYPGASVALNGGSTTHAVASYLVPIPNITVVTNSLKVAEKFWSAKDSTHNVILVGGMRTPTEALVGPVALESIRGLHVDVMFMGVHGMSDEAGFTSPNLQEAETNRAFMRSSSEVVVVADSSKWGQVALAKFATLNQAHKIITDSGLSQEASEIVAQNKVGLVKVTP